MPRTVDTDAVKWAWQAGSECGAVAARSAECVLSATAAAAATATSPTPTPAAAAALVALEIIAPHVGRVESSQTKSHETKHNLCRQGQVGGVSMQVHMRSAVR